MKKTIANTVSLLAARAGYVITRPIFHQECAIDLRRLFADQIIAKTGQLYVIQIGANDGMTNDPIHHLTSDPRWHCVMVEPLPTAFDRLSATYEKKTNIQLVNAAIGPTDGNATMYTLSSLPGRNMDDHLASFSRKTLMKHWRRVPDLEQRILARQIRTLTLRSLLCSCNFPRIDMLQIDTEGYDFEIIRMAFADGILPRVLAFEWEHLGKAAMWECRCALIERGYRWLLDKGDVIAIRDVNVADSTSSLANS